MTRRTNTRILVVDDEELIRWSLQKDLARQGYDVAVAASGGEALQRQETDPADIVLLDVNLPDGSGVELVSRLRALRDDTVVVMITSDTTVETAVQSMRQGAWDYVTKPFDFPKLYNCLERAAEQLALKQENRALRARDRAGRPPDLVTLSVAMRRAVDLAARVMENDAATVLLLGESGAGKDVLARNIHFGGARADRLFLDLNCAGLPEMLLESELFGHERGAFTDARTHKPGLLEMAAGGTVYLDEIADAPLVVQAKLLKVLEQRTFRRVGGVRDLPVDVRLIAATNRDLEQAIAARAFRADLYYRLKVFPIHVPALRERSEDILPLARGFIAEYNSRFRKRVAGVEPEAAERLADYRWPGNVRELRNVIERAMILAPVEGSLGVELLPEELGGGTDLEDARAGPVGVLAQTESRMIREALAEAGGNQSQAAAQLGISRGALTRKMRRLGITLP